MISNNMKKIFEIGLVPLIVLEDAQDAVPFGQALVRGGIPIAEVTFRTDACLDIIRAMKTIPGLIVGAGTVHNVAQAQAAVEAGAEFIITPAYNPHPVVYRKSYRYHAGNRISSRHRSGQWIRTGSLQILPSRSLWRSENFKSPCRSFCYHEIHSNRWRKLRQHE